MLNDICAKFGVQAPNQDSLTELLQPGDTTMKKFVNDPAKFVPEMLEGIALANPGQAQVRAEVQHHLSRRPAEEG